MKKNYNLKGTLANFDEAFSTRISSCTEICDCGVTYYDSYNDYDWEDGELERLIEDETSVPVDHSVGSLYFFGKTYVSVCECWKEESKKIIRFIENYSQEIADFLHLEKQRANEEAAAMPTVSEGWCNMDSAPKDGRNIKVRDKDGNETIAHFAQDLSGEEQPPFKGFFESRGRDFIQVIPVEWKIK